jgi:hypothetical protein
VQVNLIASSVAAIGKNCDLLAADKFGFDFGGTCDDYISGHELLIVLFIGD